jgi:hypothetical protein
MVLRVIVVLLLMGCRRGSSPRSDGPEDQHADDGED